MSSAPALATDGTMLFCIYVDSNQQLNTLQSDDAEQWDSPTVLTPSWPPIGSNPAPLVESQKVLAIASAPQGVLAGGMIYWNPLR